MSLKYADDCVKEALVAAEGNQVKARKKLIERALQDSSLLKALTKHHLEGIVAYHVERVASGRASKTQQPAEKPETVSAEPDDNFGKEILKAVANSSSAVFGLEGYSSPQKKSQASQQHIDAIKQMASRSKNTSE